MSTPKDFLPLEDHLPEPGAKLIRHLLDRITRVTGLPYPDTTHLVDVYQPEPLTFFHIVDRAYAGKETNVGSVEALYQRDVATRAARIVLGPNFSPYTLWGRSVLLHELTHFTQAEATDGKLITERLAYQVQLGYLFAHGGGPIVMEKNDLTRLNAVVKEADGEPYGLTLNPGHPFDTLYPKDKGLPFSA